MIGARTICDYLSLQHSLALKHSRFLIDASVLVGPLEFRELVDVATNFTGKLSRMMFPFDAHDNALGIHRIDDPVTSRQYHGTGIACSHTFHSCTDQRRFCSQQRHRLPLHVGAHQGSIGVIVLKKRNQRRSDRYQLLRADVDVVHFFAAHQNEVAGLTSVDQLADNASLVIQFHIRLSDDVLVFFPG